VSLAELLAPGADEWWAGPIEFERLADDHAAPLSYPTNGLFLFTVETEPVALLVRHDDDEHPFFCGSKSPVVPSITRTESSRNS
jgi:hypothetical protein